MPIESADYISQLDQTSPTGTEKFAVADDHIRLTKKAFRQSFPEISSECSASASELNSVIGMGGKTVLQALSDLSATLNAQLLGISSTATSANTWGASLKYIQTATPSVAVNGIWFRTEP